MTGYQYIGDIAGRLGVSSRSIRYYEELGLIVPRRTDGGFREYSGAEVEKLETILKLKKLGLSLNDIQKFIKLKQCVGSKRSAEKLLNYLQKRLREFEARIKEYKEGIREIKELIGVVANCRDCGRIAEILKCEECLKGRSEEMPKLMKAMF